MECLNKNNQTSYKIHRFKTSDALKRTARFPEKRNFSTDKPLEIEQTAELLREQVETLRQQLEYERQIVEQYQQELLCTNDEMSIINKELQNALRLEKLKLDKAMRLAQHLSSSHQSTSESLAELLSAIYGVLVTADDLEQKTNSG